MRPGCLRDDPAQQYDGRKRDHGEGSGRVSRGAPPCSGRDPGHEHGRGGPAQIPGEAVGGEGVAKPAVRDTAVEHGEVHGMEHGVPSSG